jgi:sulfate/thiosulfate-binding protein
MRTSRWVRAAAVGLVAVVMAACGSSGDDDTTTADAGSDGALPAAQLSLVVYSTPQEAYGKIIKAFNKTAAGRNITFSQSYGASGDQSRAVEAGLAADIVAFSLAPDMTRLVKSGFVSADWDKNEQKGMVTDSVVAFIVRKGNPKGIKTWADLTKPGIEVINPNPFTSGGARWNVMAAYGAHSSVGKDHDAGLKYVGELFQHIPVQDDSARKSLQTFAGGKGDVLLGYENEAIFAQAKGQAIDYVVPSDTILIENPVAVTAKTKHPAQAKAFHDFLFTETAQKIFAEDGYRPTTTITGGRTFPTPSGLFTIADLGGWADVTTRFFDPQKGLLVDIERKLGVPTSK